MIEKFKDFIKWIKENRGKFIQCIGVSVIINSALTFIGTIIVLIGLSVELKDFSKKRRKLNEDDDSCKRGKRKKKKKDRKDNKKRSTSYYD